MIGSDLPLVSSVIFVCFNDTATTEIYTYGHTLSLHDALPIESMQRPFFSHSPERVGSWPSRPPISGAGVASGTDCSVFPGAGVWVVSPIIPGSRNCCSLIPGPGLDKLPDKPTVSAHAPEKPMFALPDPPLVTLRGRDAAAFAQAQFLSDEIGKAAGRG